MSPLFEMEDGHLSLVARLSRRPLSLAPVVGEAQATGEVERLLCAVVGGVSRQQIQVALALKSEEHFRTVYLKLALMANEIEMTLPDMPQNSKER